MRKVIYSLVAILLLCYLSKASFADDLNKQKMEKITKEVLEVFKDPAADKSKMLRKYISKEWIEKKNINIDKYDINNYSPQFYNIVMSSSDICVATIGGEEWEHLLIFKFTNENGTYRLVPKGFAKSDAKYVDPWNEIAEFIYKSKDDTGKKENDSEIKK